MKTVLKTTKNTELQKKVIQWANEKAADYEGNYKAVFEDLMRGGCTSGFVSELIYYSDTVKFYNDYENDIWDLLDEKATEYGQNILGFIASLKGSNDVGSNDQFKNLLVWFAFEETAFEIARANNIEL